jgi:hypothetical protein
VHVVTVNSGILILTRGVEVGVAEASLLPAYYAEPIGNRIPMFLGTVMS